MADDRFTPEALERWSRIEQRFQFRLLNNVFCVKCRGTTTMLDHRGSIRGGVLVLEGECARCSHSVARSVESI